MTIQFDTNLAPYWPLVLAMARCEGLIPEFGFRKLKIKRLLCSFVFMAPVLHEREIFPLTNIKIWQRALKRESLTD